jgi:hypothetical protein
LILPHLEKEIRYQREMRGHCHRFGPIGQYDDDALFPYLYP